MHIRADSVLAHVLLALTLVSSGVRAQPQATTSVNPYAAVDWASVSPYRADLHVHTIQSDGCQLPEEVVTAFHDAGFAILALTDHDTVTPNLCPTRDNASPGQIEAGVFATRQSPYPDPRPENYPANPTWPWDAFGAPAPAELGMLGIEGVELTCGHHRNVFFIDYGVEEPCAEGPTINEQLYEAARLGGLAVINHPEPRFKEWYYELFRDHAADDLVGMELSTAVESSTAIWDQLLADLMPGRPVWGFATSDMHFFTQTKFAFTVFPLEELTLEAVRDAMRTGAFYSVVGPGMMDLREAGRAAYEGTYPVLLSVSVDAGTGKISIEATGYDEIVWISGASDWRYAVDPDTGIAWPPGKVVGSGPVFEYLDAELPYVRAEVIRRSDAGPVRLFLNPITLAIL